jgi:hypothetical protein
MRFQADVRKDHLNLNRRKFLRAAAAVGAGAEFSHAASGQTCPAMDGTVRDRIWVFANPVNADYNMVRKRSVMSPLEAAVYMGAPNLLMVNQYPEKGEPVTHRPFEPPFEQYAYPLKVLKRVAWSIVGAGGVTDNSERQQVLAMARQVPNIVGLFMDDFFTDGQSETTASLSLDQVRDVQRQLKQSGKKLDLYVTLYTRQLNPGITDYLKLIDVITLWTWETAELANLEANLVKLEKLAPKSRKLLGCYTARLEDATPRWTDLKAPAMQKQCETGLRWLRERRIDGIIIYGTAMDLGWESVEWAREWIQRVGDTKL